jgi:hypothetical protein
VIAPVPAPISSTEDWAGSTLDAMSRHSCGELGASAPILRGSFNKERRKSSEAGRSVLMS